MKIFLLLLLSASLVWAETPAPSPEATPSSEKSESDLEAKLRKQAEDLKREMDEKLKDAKTGTISLFEAAKKKIAEAIKEEASPTPPPVPVVPPPLVVAATPTSAPTPLPPGKITSEAISANPDLYVGQIVSLNANIKSIESDRFIIDGDIIVPANMDAFDKKETPRDRIEVKDGSLVRTTVLPQKIGRTVEEVILMPGQLISVHGKVEEIEERIVIRGNVTKVP